MSPILHIMGTNTHKRKNDQAMRHLETMLILIRHTECKVKPRFSFPQYNSGKDNQHKD